MNSGRKKNMNGTFGMNAMTAPSMAPQQTAMASQPVSAHLPIDVLDNGSQYLLVADLPGVKIEDLELTVENGLLMIKAVSQATTFVPGVDEPLQWPPSVVKRPPSRSISEPLPSVAT